MPANDTPSAEHNFWVGPDAAKVVVDELDEAGFEQLFMDPVLHGDPEHSR